jgi:starch phosphorylase
MIEEGDVKRVNMARMGIVGSSRVNGVSKAQAELLKTTLFPQLHTLSPGKFLNVTNGVSHRRWLLCDNSLLAKVITEAIGDGWIRDAEQLRKLEDFADDTGFLESLNDVKQIAKQRLLISLERDVGLAYDSTALFAVQCKRIHPYKRQVLHLLGVVWRYLRIRNGEQPPRKRLHIFAGVASPSDHLAKQIIRLIHAVAELIDRDTKAREWLRVMFVPGYGITWAEKIMPAAELAEEIATPNLEACGTTNFKMALNGAVPVISRAGANIELVEEIGQENMFVFGQTRKEIETSPDYNPSALLEKSDELRAIFEFLEKEIVSVERDETVLPLLSSLRYDDRYRVLADLGPYMERQHEADTLYGDRIAWARCTLMNIAHSGRFCSDRAVLEYTRNIWNVESVPL